MYLIKTTYRTNHADAENDTPQSDEYERERDTDPSFLGAVSDINGEINGLNHATECIDGDEKRLSRLHIRIE